MELNICHLYPDILNLYGDRGNVTCLKKRLEWRGIDCNVEGVSIGDKLEASKYSTVSLPPGITAPPCLGPFKEHSAAAITE